VRFQASQRDSRKQALSPFPLKMVVLNRLQAFKTLSLLWIAQLATWARETERLDANNQ